MHLIAMAAAAGIILTWKDLASAFERTRRKEKNAWMAACDEPSAEVLHTWRKQVKALHNQMLLIHQIMRRMKKRLKLAARLGRWLGRHHDLDVLASLLRQDAGNEDGRRIKEISRCQRKLRRRIFRAASRLHDRPLAKSAARLAERMAAAGRQVA